MRTTSLLTGLVALTLAAAGAGAQSLDAVPAGARLRLDLATGERTLRGRPRLQSVIGDAQSVGGDTVQLSLRAGIASARVARTAVTAAYVSRGKPARWRAALVGAIRPALLGAAAGGVGASIRRRRSDDPTPLQSALSSAAMGAASGAFFAAVSPPERWRRLTLPSASGVGRDSVVASTTR